MAERLKITIDGDASGLEKALKSAENRLNTFNTRVTNSSRNLTRLMGAMQGLNSSFSTLMAAANSAATALNHAATAANNYQNSTRRASQGNASMASSSESLLRQIRNLGAGLAVARTAMFALQGVYSSMIEPIMKVNAEYERQQVLLTNLSKAPTPELRQTEAKMDTKYIWDTAANAPFDISSIQDTFIKLKINGIDPTNGSMKTLLDTVAAFGGTSNNLKLSTLAISQMASKGVVSMEELRRQLGEQIPTAMKAMAEGLGYIKNMYDDDSAGMRKFYKTISKGAVDSSKAIPAMMKVLKREYDGMAEQMMNTWDGQMTKLSSAYQQMILRVTAASGDNSLFVTLKKNVGDLTAFLNSQKGDEFFKSLQNGLAALVNAFVSLTKFVYEHKTAIQTLATTYIAFKGFSIFASGIASVITLLRAVIAAQTGAQVVMVLFGQRAVQVASMLGIFNAQMAISLTALGAYGIAIAAVIAVVYMYNKAVNAKGVATKASTDALNAEKAAHAQLTQAIQTTTVATEQERKAALANFQQRKAEIAQRIANAKAALYEANAKRISALSDLKKAQDTDNAVTAGQAGPDAKFNRLANANNRRTERQDAKDATATYNTRVQQWNDLQEQYKEVTLEISKLANMKFDAPSVSAGDGGKKKADPLGDLDGSRSQLVNYIMQVKKLQAELDGTSESFNENSADIEENVRASVQNIKTQGELNTRILATKQAVRVLTAEVKTHRAEQELLKKNTEALNALHAKSVDQTLQAEEAMGNLNDSYSSITSQVQRYVNKLREQNAELLKTGTAAQKAQAEADIQNAADQRRIELLAQQMQSIKDKTTTIQESFMTESQLRDYNLQKEIDSTNVMIAEAQKVYGPQGQILVAGYYSYIETLKKRYKIDRNPFAKWAEQNKELGTSIKESLAGSLDGFVEQLANGKMAFGDFAKSLIADLAKIIIRAMIAKAILSALGLGGTVDFSGVNAQTQSLWDSSTASGANMAVAGIAHTGGIAGSLKPYGQSLAASIFAGAEKFHTGGFPGLKKNEIPVVVEKGEGIFTKEQMQAMGSSNNKQPGATSVNIINQTGVQADAEASQPRFDGEKYVIDIVMKNMSKPGPLRDSLSSMKSNR